MNDIHYFNLSTTFNYNMLSYDTQPNTQLPSFPFLQYRAHHRSINKLCPRYWYVPTTFVLPLIIYKHYLLLCIL